MEPTLYHLRNWLCIVSLGHLSDRLKGGLTSSQQVV
jgi:hypothetical protein